MRIAWQGSLVVIASIVVLGCSSQPPGSTAASGPPVNVNLTVDAARSSTVVIGSAGGSIDATAEDGTSFHLDVPAQALPADASITVTPIRSIDGLPQGAHLVAAVQFAPEGLVLAHVATLTITTAQRLPADAVIVGFSGDGQGLHLELGRIAADHVTIPVRHFSGAGVTDSSTAISTFLSQHSPGTAEGDLIQHIQQIAAASIVATGGVTAAALDEIEQALMDYYRSRVRPPLADTAIEETGVALRSAIDRFMTWNATIEYVEFAIEGSRLVAAQQQEDGRKLCVDRITAQIDFVAEKVNTSGDWTVALEIFRDWVRLAMVLGIDSEQNALDAASVAKKVPIKIVAELTLPAEIGATDTIDVRVGAGVQIGNRAPRYDIVLDVDLRVAGGSPASDTGETTAGTYERTGIALDDGFAALTVTARVCFATLGPYITTTVDQLVPGTVVLTMAGPASLTSGSHADFVATLAQGRARLVSRTVMFTTAFGWVSPIYADTDATGQATARYDAPSGAACTGSGDILASYAGRVTVTAQAQVACVPALLLSYTGDWGGEAFYYDGQWIGPLPAALYVSDASDHPFVAFRIGDGANGCYPLSYEYDNATKTQNSNGIFIDSSFPRVATRDCSTNGDPQYGWWQTLKPMQLVISPYSPPTAHADLVSDHEWQFDFSSHVATP